MRINLASAGLDAGPELQRKGIIKLKLDAVLAYTIVKVARSKLEPKPSTNFWDTVPFNRDGSLSC